HDGASGHERMNADTTELMHHHAAAQNDMIMDGHMPRERHHVRQYGMAADLRVVREMHVGHDPVVVADACDADILHGTGVECAEFADRVVIADLEASGLATVLLVLR